MRWTYSSICCDGSDDRRYIVYDLHQYYVEDDITINEIKYRKLWKVTESTEIDNVEKDTNYTYHKSYTGAIRQNADMEVYFISRYEDLSVDEKMLYYFDHQLYDTLHIDPIIKVSEVDSVETVYGYKKKFTIQEYALYRPEYATGISMSVIEGIGATHDLISGLGIFSNLNHLQCYTVDGEIIYKHNESTFCKNIKELAENN